MPASLTRRRLLQTAGLACGAAVVDRVALAQRPAVERNPSPFRYCLNTSTIRGQKLPLPEIVDLAGQAGYDAIEPWMGELETYVQGGGSLDDLGKRIRDAGLTVESAIGFAQWIVDDPEMRKQGLEQARKDMATLKKIGGIRLAAPPVGKTKESVDLFAAAERYRALLEVGDQEGVVPQVEVWGFSKSLSRLGESTFVAIESGHPQACLLPDVYHIYKGGSDFTGLKLLGPAAIRVFHVNDYPADPPRATIGDADRVYPGDGVAPLDSILRMLRDGGFRIALSLELFNRTYWQQDAKTVLKTGLEKMRTAVARALA